MTEERINDEIKQMYEEGTERVLDSNTFRIPLEKVPMKPAILLDAGTTIRQAAERMKGERQGCVLVQDKGAVVGIFTERDALLRIQAAGLDPSKTTLREVMTPGTETLTSVQTLRHAMHLMVNRGLRHIPILKEPGGPPLGILSARDVLSFLAEYFPEDVKNLPPRPRDFMSKDGG